MSSPESTRLPRGLLSLRVFGSTFRGDADPASDLDILAVLDINRKPPEEPVSDYVMSLFGKKASISWYSLQRIKEIFQEGHLFAWHIFLESEEILPGKTEDVIKQLGQPSAYRSAGPDIDSLIAILSPIGDAIVQCPRNIIYEAGLIYVCARNIGMSASSFSSKGLDFSRYSPYNLKIEGLHFPIARSDYERLIQARNSSIRGSAPPQLIGPNILQHHADTLQWAEGVQKHLGR